MTSPFNPEDLRLFARALERLGSGFASLPKATLKADAISSFADVNTILAAGRADLCLLGFRPKSV